MFHVICDIHMCAIKRDMLFAHFCIFSCDMYMEENRGKLEPGIRHNIQVCMCVQLRFKSVCTSTQSDQFLSFTPEETLDP